MDLEDPAAEVERLLDEAFRRADEKDFAGALALCDRAQWILDASDDIQLVLAEELEERRRFARASLARDRARERAERGDAGGTEAACREMIALDYDWDEWLLLGWLLVRLPGREAEGVDALTRALESSTSWVVAEAAHELANQRILARDLPRARRMLALVVEQEDTDATKQASRLLFALPETPGHGIVLGLIRACVRVGLWRTGRSFR